MTQITQYAPGGYFMRRYGSFAHKAAASPATALAVDPYFDPPSRARNFAGVPIRGNFTVEANSRRFKAGDAL